jgi:hypothetical protein
MTPRISATNGAVAASVVESAQAASQIPMDGGRGAFPRHVAPKPCASPCPPGRSGGELFPAQQLAIETI